MILLFDMKIKNLLKQATKKIDYREALLLLAHIMKKDEAFILAHDEQDISIKLEIKYNKMVNARMKNKPIAYILGKQPFCNLNFKVNKNTLIPRPETEQLVDLVTNNIDTYSQINSTRALQQKNKRNVTKKNTEGNVDRKKNQNPQTIIIDIGTGSGCIACSLKHRFPKAEVIASDISPATLRVVKYNNKKLSTNIKVIHSNLFSGVLHKSVEQLIIKLKKRVDLHIIANLSYLPHSDKDNMQKDVIYYEPIVALFADDQGMALIKKCMQQLHDFLLPYSPIDTKWTLYFEIDPRQKSFLKSYAKNLFSNSQIQIKKDLSNKNRFLIISNRE